MKYQAVLTLKIVCKNVCHHFMVWFNFFICFFWMVDKSNLVKDLCKPMTCSVWNGHFDIPHTKKQKDIVWLGFGCKCNQQWLAFWPILINCDCEALVDGVLTDYSACVHTHLFLIDVRCCLSPNFWFWTDEFPSAELVEGSSTFAGEETVIKSLFLVFFTFLSDLNKILVCIVCTHL